MAGEPLLHTALSEVNIIILNHYINTRVVPKYRRQLVGFFLSGGNREIKFAHMNKPAFFAYIKMIFNIII